MLRCSPVLAVSLLAIVLAGCGGADGPEASGSTALPLANKAAPRVGPTPPERAAPDENLPRARRGAPLAQGDGGYSVDTTSREQVRLFYKTVHASSNGVPSGWTGNTGTCTPGDTSAQHKAAVLRRLNWYRAMAGVPATVTFDAALNAKAQEAALWMARNETISHFPPSGTPCYSATAAEAAGKSNLAIGTLGVGSVKAYMEDTGEFNNVVGHRRWLLYPQTQLMGVGDVEQGWNYNAIWVQDGNMFAPRPATRDGFVAWPPKGYVPYTEVFPRWSASYPGANFSAAVVTMLENGVPMTTVKETVVNGYGENTLVWRPVAYADGAQWTRPASDTTYTITIANITGTGVPPVIAYTTTVFDPDQSSAGDGPIALSGAGTAYVGEPSAISFSAIPGATAYEWRAMTSSPFSLNDGAESGSGNFTLTTSPGYDPVANDVGAGSASSFHLAHTQPADQVMLLNQQLVAGPGASLQFDSRLGASASGQRAMVEVSADDGVSWTVVYDQVGSQGGGGFGEEGFSARSISLAAYADRVLKVRFRYAFTNGLYFPQSSTGVGWYIDNVRGTGLNTVVPGASTTTASASFSFVPSAAGTVMLQARPGMNGYFAEWGLVKTVTVTTNPMDCFFNWVEAQYPQLGAPAGAGRFDPYYYRYYPVNGGIYVVHYSIDDHVYYSDVGGVHEIGTRAQALAVSGCPA
ncbi:MAG: CAP domain-containing protein [Pseudomonadota bacterium]